MFKDLTPRKQTGFNFRPYTPPWSGEEGMVSASLSHITQWGKGRYLVQYQGSVRKKRMIDAERDRAFTTGVYWQVHFTNEQTEAQGITAYLGARLANSGTGI